MTMPVERTLATLKTLAFLHELAKREDVPEDVRNTALGLARHFPRGVDIQRMVRAMAHGNPLREEIFCLDDDLQGSELQQAFDAARKYDF